MCGEIPVKSRKGNESVFAIRVMPLFPSVTQPLWIRFNIAQQSGVNSVCIIAIQPKQGVMNSVCIITIQPKQGVMNSVCIITIHPEQSVMNAVCIITTHLCGITIPFVRTVFLLTLCPV